MENKPFKHCNASAVLKLCFAISTILFRKIHVRWFYHFTFIWGIMVNYKLELPLTYTYVKRKKKGKTERERGLTERRRRKRREADGERKEEETVGNQEEEGKLEKKASLREFIHPLPQISPHIIIIIFNFNFQF